MALARFLLNNVLQLETARRIDWWSDGGKHFRSVSSISTMILQGLQTLATKSKVRSFTPVFNISYGVPSHFNNCCDGCHSAIRAMVSEIAKEVTLSTLPQLHKALQVLHEERRSIPPGPRRPAPLPMVFHDFFPAEARPDFVKSFMTCFRPASFLEAVGTCQSFEGKLNDRRRIGNVGYLSGANIYTAIDFKACMLNNGQVCPASRICWPIYDSEAHMKIANAAADDEEGDASDGEVAAELAADFAFAHSEPGNGEISMGTTMHRGWKSSYRRAEPEERNFKSWRSRWSKQRRAWEKSGIRLLPPRTRRGVQEQLALQKRWKSRSRLRPAEPELPAGASSSCG